MKGGNCGYEWRAAESQKHRGRHPGWRERTKRRRRHTKKKKRTKTRRGKKQKTHGEGEKEGRRDSDTDTERERGGVGEGLTPLSPSSTGKVPRSEPHPMSVDTDQARRSCCRERE